MDAFYEAVVNPAQSLAEAFHLQLYTGDKRFHRISVSSII
jgi:hypothetical protein